MKNQWSTHLGCRLECLLAVVLFAGPLWAQHGGQAKPVEAPKPAAEPGKTPSATPTPEPAKSTPQASPTASTELKLEGLKLTVPSGWQSQEVEKAPMAPVAVFKIPKGDGADDGMVRITHYPNMKGKDMDDRNIDRWVGQVTKPDGSPMTRADAKISTSEAGGVKITTVDITGSVKMTMRDSAKGGHRMIAAILDHPKGPHFVVTAGPTASMDKWAAQIETFLKSAKTE